MVIKQPNTTHGSDESAAFFKADQLIPVMLVAFAPEGSVQSNRCVVSLPFKIGRDPAASLAVDDGKVSKKHLCITRDDDGFLIEDLGSTNGTFVNGRLLERKEKHALPSPSIIRVGRAVLVFQGDAKALVYPEPEECFGMAGIFHVGPLLMELRQSVISGRHVLLAGPSGAGKELCARALACMMGKDNQPLLLVSHNAARFTSEEEAASTLFGVGPKVFSDVDPRAGVVEQAHGGALFLDEIHNLPERVQRSLLRVIEDGLTSRIGETTQRDADVRFIFASNAPGPGYSLAHDLLARLRVVRVPPLAERTADIPSIFNTILSAKLHQHELPAGQIFSRLGGDHYESMCLDGFKTDNVRGLVDLADKLVSKVAFGIEPSLAMKEVFSDRFGTGLVARRYAQDSSPPERDNSYYEKNKDVILDAYRECHGNIKMTADLLKSRGIRCSRRWLAVYADKWGLRKKK